MSADDALTVQGMVHHVALTDGKNWLEWDGRRLVRTPMEPRRPWWRRLRTVTERNNDAKDRSQP